MTSVITNAVLTAYCACATCCGTQNAKKGITAAGTRPIQGITIAASRKIPLGSKVQIGQQTFIVQDRLARKYDSRFDLYFTRHEDAKRFGKHVAKVTIYGR